jgi:hypothetical protein
LRKTDPKAAIQVSKLRRPTVAAWALNTVARAHPAAVRHALDAGEELRNAQQQALRGDGTALRKATEDRRRAVAEVGSLVAEVLGDRAPAQAAAVSATLEAATVDENVAELLRHGRLDKEHAAAGAGFGFGDAGDWTPPPKAKPPKQKNDDLAKQLDQAVTEATERGEELHAAEAEVSRLKQELAAATKAARDARTRANKAELHAETLRQRAWEEGERGR